MAPTGTVSGKVTHLTTGEPVEGVRVFALEDGGTDVVPADLSMPGLANADFKFADVDTTDANGEYELTAPAGALNGNTTTIFAYRSGMFFTPDRVPMTISAGQSYPASFQGLRLSTITGRIMDEDGTSPAAGVTVTAVGGTANVTRTATTTANGRYIIRVPWGPYTVTPSKGTSHHDTFDPASLQATLGAEENKTLQNFEAMGPPLVRLVLDKPTIDETTGSNIATVTATLSKAIAEAFTVTVSTTDTDGFDQTGTDLSFAANATTSTGSVTITAENDTDTDNETVTVSAVADTDNDPNTPWALVRQPASVTVAITDDDRVPSAPTITSATPGNAQVTLLWTFPTDQGLNDGARATITGYEYCVKATPTSGSLACAGNEWQTVTDGGQTQAIVTVLSDGTGLTNDTQYSFMVRAESGAGKSEASAVVTATPKAP